MTRRELTEALLGATGVMLATCVPYFIVWWYTPLDGFFPGLLFNSDDHGAYFAWMRQGAEGKVLFRNLFTTDPQRGIYFQPYFLLLGLLSRVPGLDIPAAYHLGRVLFGILALVLVYRLAALVTEDRFARRCAFWVTALSAGLGWLFWSEQATPERPVDVWQPEALTYLSVYANGLFAVSLVLMLGVLICLLLAEERGARWAVGAGLCGLALGVVHSYDVIHLTVAWTAYLLGRWVVERRVPAKAFGHALLAAAVAAPSVAYMAWYYATEPAFKARADTATLAPDPTAYAWGYGLLIPLALWGAVVLARGPEREKAGTGAGRAWLLAAGGTALALGAAIALFRAPAGQLRPWIPLVPAAGWLAAAVLLGRGETAWTGPRLAVLAWAAAGLGAAYLPFAFQRKMAMGYHFPLGLLAGVAAAQLCRAAVPGRGRLAAVGAAVLVAVLSLTSVRFMQRDVETALRRGTTSTGIHLVYEALSRLHAYEWLGGNTPPGAVLLSSPLASVLAPAYSGRTVYAGHWAETPRFQDRYREALAFFGGRWTSAERLAFLRANGITHVLVGPPEQALVERAGVPGGRPVGAEPYLTPVFQEKDTTILAVRP